MRFKTWFYQEDSINPASNQNVTADGSTQTQRQNAATTAKIANTAATLPGMRNVMTTRDPKTQQSMAIDLAGQAEKKVTGKTDLSASPIQAANNLLQQIQAPLIGQKPGMTNSITTQNKLQGV